MNDFGNNSETYGQGGRINRRPEYGSEGPKKWWRMSRRTMLIGGGVGVAALTGAGIWWLVHDETSEVDKDTLELQKTQGWNVGSEDKKLTFTNAQTVDSLQTDAWKKYLDQNAMLGAFTPKSATWAPYFVPTLIQSLQAQTLRSQMTPEFTTGMREAYDRGQAIAKDFLANAQNPSETAIIADLPGPEAVAFGAGLASNGRLLTTFDNYPHPLGVTPSHETLAAMLYYAAEIESKQAGLPDNAPPVFLLDSNRLAPYKDADNQFDNRYLAKVPTAANLKQLGVKSVIYAMPDRTRKEELDDLNDSFVEYKNAGVNIAMLPLSDFTAVTELSKDPAKQNQVVRHYYYGGSPMSHMYFFYSYPFYSPTPMYVSRYPAYSSIRSGGIAPQISPPRYAPVSRPTMFSGTRIGGANGVGRSKPSGFGRATVRVAPNGSVVGTRAGKSGYYSRSGSFGRGGGWGG